MKHALQASLLLIALAAIIAPPRAVAEPAPRRVVSINLCSDILALPLAAPGTVVSVFRLAVDPQDSPVAHLAQGLVLNDARA
jgi:iron complex transport system substrate-binding protein